MITTPTEITAPREVGDVVVATCGALTVRGVGEPGLRLRGNLAIMGAGSVLIEDSVVEVLSTYHGQYAVAAMEQGRLTVRRCTYRVPSGVQHAIVALDSAEVTLEDTAFGFNQLMSQGNGRLVGRRLDGSFEVIVQDASTMELSDIPRQTGKGDLWVWPEFPAGSTAVHSPPLPGRVDHWQFPPAGATGIPQRITLERCQVKLWPLLVEPGCDLTLRDIAPENWVVAGFHLPSSGTVTGLANNVPIESATLPLSDRVVRVERSTVDTWNLYPQQEAEVEVRDCWIGELLAMERSRVRMVRTVVDGTGGYLGAEGSARLEVERSWITCDVQATGESTLVVRESRVAPYPTDPTGEWTRFGAYDTARLFLDRTLATSTLALGGQGLVAAWGLAAPSTRPPRPGETLELAGTVLQLSLDPAVAAGSWRLEAVPSDGGAAVPLGGGQANVEDGPLGTWPGSAARRSWTLRMVLTDGLGRTLEGAQIVPSELRARRRLPVAGR